MLMFKVQIWPSRGFPELGRLDHSLVVDSNNTICGYVVDVFVGHMPVCSGLEAHMARIVLA